MPFDDSKFVAKGGLKQISGQKSMFDAKPRPPTQQQLEQKAQATQDQKTAYQKRGVELFVQFSKCVADKTLPQNKNILGREAERELKQNLVNFAKEANADENEDDGEGSLALIVCLINTCLSQRDRLNEMEYVLLTMQKKTDAISDLVKKEVSAALDAKK